MGTARRQRRAFDTKTERQECRKQGTWEGKDQGKKDGRGAKRRKRKQRNCNWEANREQGSGFFKDGGEEAVGMVFRGRCVELALRIDQGVGVDFRSEVRHDGSHGFGAGYAANG